MIDGKGLLFCGKQAPIVPRIANYVQERLVLFMQPYWRWFFYE